MAVTPNCSLIPCCFNIDATAETFIKIAEALEWLGTPEA